MHIPDRKTDKPRKPCTWRDGCEKLALQNSRFCQVHTNMTIYQMRDSGYLTPLVRHIKWFYRSTVKSENWHNY